MTLQTKTGDLGQNSALPTCTLSRVISALPLLRFIRTAGLLSLKEAREQDARKLTNREVMLKALVITE